MAKKVIHPLELEELARHITGLDDYHDYDDIGCQLYEQFNIDFESFEEIASKLIMMTMPIERDDKLHYAFFDLSELDKGRARAIARIVDGK